MREREKSVATDVLEKPVIPRRSSSRRVLGALWTSIGTALSSLRGNWFRSFLTILGVVIGVASVIILVAFGEGARKEITGHIDTLGTNVAVIVPGKMRGQMNFNPTGGLGLSNLSHRDVEAVRSVRGVRRAAPITFLGGGVYYKEKPASICMPIATTPDFYAIRRIQTASGRFLGAEDQNRSVCVLGVGVRKDLFGEADPIGKEITVNEHPYRVIGTVRERNVGSGLFGGDELDAIIYLPLSTVEHVTKTSQLHRIMVEVEPSAEPDTVSEAVRARMQESHRGRDDFSILRAKELLDMFYRVFSLLAALLIGITSISLVVGGIGIMNIMLVSVTERTREIGIRKTVGARRSDIFWQFLTEAVTLSLLGGVLGILLAVVVCRLVQFWLPLKPEIALGSVFLGFGVCVAVGVTSGVLPAVAAARKDPIEAIRYE
jgi:putative ABC transport system permease protein